MVTAGRNAFKTKLKDIHKEVVSKSRDTKPKDSSSKLMRLILGIVAMLVIGAVAWFAFGNKGNENLNLFNSHYEPYALKLALRDNVSDQRVDKVMELYHKKEFKNALPLLEELTLEKGDRGQELLALAISRFESGDKANAFLPLNQIIDSNHPFLIDQARWYSALFYLKDYQNSKAITFLNELALDSRADHHDDAKDILNKLK